MVSLVLMDGVKQNVNGSLTIVVRRDREPSHNRLFASLVIVTSVQFYLKSKLRLSDILLIIHGINILCPLFSLANKTGHFIFDLAVNDA